LHNLIPAIDEVNGIVLGAIARTYFYIADRYEVKLSKSQKQKMKAWDRAPQ
jgi:endonuclease I